MNGDPFPCGLYIPLAPLSSTRYVVKESDKSGGSGARFMVTWKSEEEVNPPIIEIIMMSTLIQQGISSSSRGMSTKEYESNLGKPIVI